MSREHFLENIIPSIPSNLDLPCRVTALSCLHENCEGWKASQCDDVNGEHLECLPYMIIPSPKKVVGSPLGPPPWLTWARTARRWFAAAQDLLSVPREGWSPHWGWILLGPFHISNWIFLFKAKEEEALLDEMAIEVCANHHDRWHKRAWKIADITNIQEIGNEIFG